MYRAKEVVAVIVLVAVVATVSADMPVSYNTALNNLNTLNILCVKNYQAGVSFTEAYSDFEHLDKDTTVISRNSLSSDQLGANQSAIDATINSNVIGRASLSWRSLNPLPAANGRHNLIGSNAEALTGVFSINKLIQLWSNSSINAGSIEWLPCV